MKLDTVTLIEQFLTDVLLSSPQIPLGVNVIRLAATTDEEGIAQLTRSIVVRYTGSSINITQRQPLIIERTMKFELIHSSQSYLSESGHDSAIQMCAGAFISLNNSVPMGVGAKILVPFTMSNESFEGLTDSSHYVYVQNWEVTALDVSPSISMDPCVLQGNCSELFPMNFLGGVLPGDVIEGNLLYSPIIPPPTGIDFEEEYCGVLEVGNDLVYKHNPSLVFLKDWTNYDLVSTGKFVEDSKMLICHIKDKEGNFIDLYYAANCDERGLIGIKVYDELSQGQIENLQQDNDICYTSQWPKAELYVDPREEDTHISYLKYGWVLRINTQPAFTFEGKKYHKVWAPSVGSGYVDADDVTFLNRRYTQTDVCEYDGASNEGPPICE